MAERAGNRLDRPDLLFRCLAQYAPHAGEGVMTSAIGTRFNYRIVALIRKDFQQTRRAGRLALSMVVPPVLQVILFGYVLNSKVTNLGLGVLDQSGTPESRELIANLNESRSFRLTRSYLSLNEMSAAISRGQVKAGVVIPYDFARNLQRGRTASVQFLLNAMDANTATIAKAYAEGVLASYNQGLRGSGLHANFRRIAAPDVSRRG